MNHMLLNGRVEESRKRVVLMQESRTIVIMPLKEAVLMRALLATPRWNFVCPESMARLIWRSTIRLASWILGIQFRTITYFMWTTGEENAGWCEAFLLKNVYFTTL